MNMAGSEQLIARCSCGKCEIRASGRPMYGVVCYCDDCRSGGYALQSLQNSTEVFESDGGVQMFLYRRDWVKWAAGESDRSFEKNSVDAPTRRYFCNSCNSAMCVEFEDFRPWVSIYSTAVNGDRPKINMRIFTKFAESPEQIAGDVPSYFTYPISMVAKVMLNLAIYKILQRW